jgi:polysaccharide chain length determinant protein (PEP-CTERM system associated)
MEDRPFHPLDYVSVLRRRKWWFVVPLVTAIVVGTLLAVFLPREYKSEAQIGIAAPTLSPELLRGVQSLDAAERQRAISQQLLSQTVLERVVREEQLSPEKPVEQTAQVIRARVEKNIVVPNPIGRADTRSGIDSFILGYVDSSPERAQRIANRLATVFVEENSKTRTQQAQNTSEVLGQQLRESQEKLARLEEQLRVKKEAYMGRLPAQMDANLQTVNGLRQQHESISIQLRGEQDQLRMVESQLDMMRQGGGAGGSLTSAGAAAIQAAQSRYNTLQQQLMEARARGYTDAHPEIDRINREMAEAERELSTARKQNPETLQTDPLFRQKTQERDAIRLRIAGLQRQASHTSSQIAEYQRRVEAAPMVEQELSSLTQQHELEKERVATLSKEYQNALTAEDLARKQGGERFSVLYAAALPTKPASPDILRLMLLAIAIGLAGGAGAVIGREFLDRSVHDARALQSEFEVPVLGEIPHIHGVA